MKNLVQINILIKRMLCRPAMIAVLMLIPMALILVHVLPEKKQSTEIVSGIFIETPDEYTDSFTGYLYNTATGFTFQPYESLPDMKDDVASGKLDAGYSFPVDFSQAMIHMDTNVKVDVYTSAGSSFENVTCESVYAALLYAYAADMSINMLGNRYIFDTTSIDIEDRADKFIRERFNGYIENDDIFSISGGLSGKYTSPDKIVPNNFPAELLIYMTIFICALLGTQNYLKDLDNGVYSSLPGYRKLSFCTKNIAAGIIPTAIMSFISLIIYMSYASILYITVHIAVVSVISLASSMLTGMILRRYKVFTIAMPFVIICTLLPLLLAQLSQM